MTTPRALTASLLAALVALPVHARDNSWGVREPSFRDVIQQVVSMPQDADLVRRARERHQLHVVNVMWEDTGRSLGSALGPNISDLTLQVHEKTEHGTRAHLLPVLRHPNFTDKTADIAADKLWVRVGNQLRGGEPVAMPLTEVLAHLKEYLSDGDSVVGEGNLLAERDTHFLVSAQHVFVPLPKSGKVEFNPVLFNYQSAPGSPAVLTLLVTRQGMSATVIENRRDDATQAGWGQQLFFNHEGEKTLFTAERKSAVKARIEAGRAQAQDVGALDEGADMMMIVQVPLRHESRGRLGGATGGGGFGLGMPSSGPPPMAAAPGMARRARGASDVEAAVLGHGEALGRFEEGRGLKLERDDRFPVRVTIQFYKATSNGVVSDQDLADAARTIDKVYESADFVGSLVVPKGEQKRPTAWTTAPVFGSLQHQPH